MSPRTSPVADLRLSLTTRERELLSLIRDEGPITRAALIQRSGLSGTAVFRATEELAAKGYLLIGDPVASGRGQPSNLVGINPDAVFSLGISVMNDFAEAAIMDLTGAVRRIADISAPGMRRADVIDQAIALLEQAVASGLPRNAFAGVGIALAGYFVERGERLLNPASALDDWAMIDLESELSARFNLPVTIDNIANAAVVGELMLGAGSRFTSFAYVNFAYGFGGGVVIDGRPWRGAHGNAGEFASILNDTNSFVPGLESLRVRLGAAGIVAGSVTELVANFDPDWPVLDGWIADAAASIRLLTKIIGAGFDVEAVVLGGRLPPVLAGRLAAAASLSKSELDAAARRGRARPVPVIVPATVSSRASVIGAAALSMPFLRSGGTQ
ncbi:ROK family transcriptional regulator [Novosphingobium sp.]|uniref:ROK family transcriptional regulator n=1 Tax=Novosphingobium sp. TaxID=1874826 RepID=UPI0026124244|nr:ROK family transcriptional regulator [Novosphingobium sp.]